MKAKSEYKIGSKSGRDFHIIENSKSIHGIAVLGGDTHFCVY